MTLLNHPRGHIVSYETLSVRLEVIGAVTHLNLFFCQSLDLVQIFTRPLLLCRCLNHYLSFTRFCVLLF